jgi:putative transposase
MQYRRARIEGGTFFFTVVTYHRQRILCIPENVLLLRRVHREVMENHPFRINAFVLLPDHLHCIWTLPPGDTDFSSRWRLIKSNFSRRCNKKTNLLSTASRAKKGEQAIWQRRFWEHMIRDDDDFRRHVEYIHYNPVKHGMVEAPVDWEYSSFHWDVRDGIYDRHWGVGISIDFDPTTGNE